MDGLCTMWSLLAVIAVIKLTNGQLDTSQEKLQELCSRYKFLWSDANPSVFYYCFTDKAAVQLKCRTGYYMCKRENETFHPCDCKFDGNLDEVGRDDDTQEAPENGFKSNGCPDPFLKYSNMHRFGGVEADAESVGVCQLKCLQDEDCIGCDWVTATRQCYILPKRAENYALSAKDGVDHYMKTSCPDEMGVTPQQNNDVVSSNRDRDDPSDNEAYYSGLETDGGRQALPVITTDATPRSSTGGLPGGFTLPTATQAPVEDRATCTETIPDSGCPFALEKFALMSHPFGTNITTTTELLTEEACKGWCINRAFCKGVDWDIGRSTCYWFPEIQPQLATAAALVNHYRKTTCGRPLNCWVQTGSATENALLAVTDPTTTQAQCSGMCFVSQTVMPTPTLTRGCQAVAARTTPPRLGCMVTNNAGAVTMITCYCDTDRCNGLSIKALTAQILYLPLDGNLNDKSGNDRHAVVANAFSAPTFSCLDRMTNCSALFLGSQCISVNSMSQFVWGQFEATTREPKLTLAASFKRLNDGSTVEEGIFGNSLDSSVDPSWEFVGTSSPNQVRAGLSSAVNPTGLNDFRRGWAPIDQWHSAVLTYDGRSLINQKLPLTQFYIDAMKQSGNEQADEGDVEVRSQPVTIGCVKDKMFTGFIDEVRIFSERLEFHDVQALNIMRDSLYM